MRKQLLGILLASFVFGGIALAGAIHTWAPGDVFLSSDINSTLQHIHNSMVGSGHNLLVNADVSASAAITHSKLATPALVPKAWAYVAATCASGTCTLAASSGISSITAGGTNGTYTVTFSTARADANYGVIVTPMNPDANGYMCGLESPLLTTAFSFDCYKHDNTASDVGFSVMVLDNL